MKTLRALGSIVTLLVVVGLAGCADLFSSFTECIDLAPEATPTVSAGTAAGTSWVYQLQNANPVVLGATEFDIVVMDYSSDGSAEGAYPAAELNAIRTGNGAKTILAYFSIGEAEDYRPYFDPLWVNSLTRRPSRDAPCWLGLTNRDWPGNYKVQYWSAAWHAVVLAYLDEIITAGFDGVYLDIIDAYEYWADDENGEGYVLDEREAADRMINLVLAIASHAPASDPAFLVFPQNGEPILAFDDGAGAFPAGTYLAAISGIGIEDLYYDGTEPRDPTETSERVAYLETIRDAGKAVIVVDYVDDGSDSSANADRIASFRTAATDDGFIPYAALEDRTLDSINTADGQP